MEVLEHKFPWLKLWMNRLPEPTRKCFLNSFLEKSTEDWEYFFSILEKHEDIKVNPLELPWKEPQCFDVHNIENQGYSAPELHEIGENCFRNGQIAMLTVAGGLGTRLNFSGPKGLVPVTPIKHKTLFEVFSEKLKALEKKYGRCFHWLIMTSEETDFETRKAFEEQNWYDLNYIHFFKQGTLPTFTKEGVCLLNSDGSVRYCPDGHGGVFSAIDKAGLLQSLRSWGIKTLNYFQVDNPLVSLGDTLFLGLHEIRGSDFSTKVISKRSSDERVGVFVDIEGRLQLVEYSEFPEILAKQRNKDGKLSFRHGNTAMHLLSVDFVSKCVRMTLPCHVAIKKMESWDPVFRKKTFDEVYKLERFIFDVLPYAKNPLLFEVQRSEEFSPVKNAQGEDSLLTCQRDQCQRWLNWLRKKLGKDFYKILDCRAIKDNNLKVEVSPIFADSYQEFSAAWDGIEKKPEDLYGLCLD